MFYQTVITSVLFYAVVCWGGSIKRRDATRLDKLVRKAGSVVGNELDTRTSVAEKCPTPSAPNLFQAEKLLQWQAVVPGLLYRQTEEVICPSGFTALQLFPVNRTWTGLLLMLFLDGQELDNHFCTLFILFIFVFYVYTFYACVVVCFYVATGHLNFPSGINKEYIYLWVKESWNYSLPGFINNIKISHTVCKAEV